jgi:hypothetical protein
VCRGGAGTSCSISARGDLPFLYCADEDLDGDAREGEDLGGVTPPTPCKEFIEALRSKLGVEDRASKLLMALGLRGLGLREGILPFGDGL